MNDNVNTEESNKALTDEHLPLRERMGILEAILFVSGDAVELSALKQAVGLSDDELTETLEALDSEYEFDRRGMRLLRFGNHVQLTTRQDYAKYIERILQPVQKQSLSMAVMETLAVVAYKQPVTKSEVEQVRGVKCDYSIQSLMNKGLIEEKGRKETVGRPMLFGTTDAFLRHFAISSLEELPKIDFSVLDSIAQGAQAKQSGQDDKGQKTAPAVSE